MSIGRTDLPGGDYDTLINSIKTVLLPLTEDTQVFCGHGPSTNIGFEKGIILFEMIKKVFNNKILIYN